MNELLVELKNRLRITWNDDDSELLQIIERGKSYFFDLTGKTFTFSVTDNETELLLERCRYVYNNATDEFETNFANELKRLILKVALEKRS